MATRSAGDILSNSSMHTIPLSANTIAPASSRRSDVSLSMVTAAVSPTPEAPRPVVEMARGAMLSRKRSSWDLPQEGSPIISRWMSPRMWLPFSKLRSTPPSSSRSMPLLTSSLPHIDGANERAANSNRSSRPAIASMFVMSRGVVAGCSFSLCSCSTLVRISTVRKMPDVVVLSRRHIARYTPVTFTLSPGLTRSTRSSSAITSTLRGSWPVGACSGISCTVNCW
mmetsp:Transcript_43133/g.107782  ORF Transcript_43133/g.107782 Transcript_43133/m.107782 type:complete len:226 (+) Transcript_43133:344-1021(+)